MSGELLIKPLFGSLRSHLFGSVATRGRVGLCCGCGKHFGLSSKIFFCRLCSRCVHKKCVSLVSADCEGGSICLSDGLPKAEPVLEIGSSWEDVEVDGVARFGMLGLDMLWLFESKNKHGKKIPVLGLSLPGASLLGSGSDFVFSSVFGDRVSLSGMSSGFVNAMKSRISEVTENFFAPRGWSEQKEHLGLIICQTERAIMEEVVLGNTCATAECAVFDADELELPYVIQVRACKFAVSEGQFATPIVTITVLSEGVILGRTLAAVPNMQWVKVANSISRLHASAVLLFSLSLGSSEEHVHVPLCDEGGRMLRGAFRLSLWPGSGSRFQFNFGAPPIEQFGGSTLEVWLGHPIIEIPIVFRNARAIRTLLSSSILQWHDCPVEFVADSVAQSWFGSRQRIFASDSFDPSPLDVLSVNERLLHWTSRDASKPESVFRALSSFDSSVPSQRLEVTSSLLIVKIIFFKVVDFVEEVNLNGTRLTRMMALELQLHMHSSALIRHLAARHLLAWNVSLGLFALASISALAFDPHDCNPAAVVFLRVLSSPHKSAVDRHNFYWTLFSLAQQQHSMNRRFALYLQIFLRMLPVRVATSFSDSGAFVTAVNNLARDDGRKIMSLSELAHCSKHISVLKAGLISLPTSLSDVSLLDLTRSKALSSNAKPLMLCFPLANSPNRDQILIWKAGDDLATDELVMSLGMLMNTIWKNAGLNVFVQCYKVYPFELYCLPF